MRLIDLVGQRVGSLVVVERAPTRKRVTYWTCLCDCGHRVDVGAGHLRRAERTSCGHIDPGLAAGRRPWPRDPRILAGEDGSIVGVQGRLLRPWLDEKGYPKVSLYGVGPARRNRQIFVHAIVCETYHGPRPDGMEVAHLDGDPSNPRADNLQWKTHIENEADKLLHGTHRRGEDVYCAKLTEGDVRVIRSAAAAGASLTALAAGYPVSVSTISRVVRGRIWKHVA